jgi:putative N6-adenine-specific DNA methylase
MSKKMPAENNAKKISSSKSEIASSAVSTPGQLRLFAVCANGFEPFTRHELSQLSLVAETASTETSFAPSQEEDSGGIQFSGGLEAMYRANLHLRTASRVLLRFGQFHAAAFSELRRKANNLPWENYLSPGQPVAMRVTCRKSRLYHSAAVAREIAAAIGDRLGTQPELLPFNEELETQLVIARLVDDECTLSIDTSGALLHRRGYRLATAKAPLRETLAAAMLLASGWDARSPLLDPFCGSGTIPIEAALLARRLPPGGVRHFAFMDWPDFDLSLWESLLVESRKQLRTDLPIIQASDRDAGAIQMAQANAERAGVAEYIEFTCRAVSAVEPAGLGWVVTNPPYGLRVRTAHDLRNLYAQFGKVLRYKCPGWQVAILCSEMILLNTTDLRLDTSISWVNGGVPVKLGRGVVTSTQ